MKKRVFDQLDERIQVALEKFKLNEPTPIQRLAIKPILAGLNCLLISETGTGKTLGAMLPVFHKWLEEKPKPVSILYVSPMKSLNRDMLEHLLSWGKELGMEITVRHGDTSQYERKLQVEFPNDMMIVTLETLQPILTGKRIREHLRNIRWVIVDECHEVVNSKRGVQLVLALERLRELCGDFQLLMLSATIGEPEKVARFFVGNRLVKIVKAKTEKPIEIRVVNPKPRKGDKQIAEKVFSSLETASRLRTIIGLIKQSKSSLTFTNTREFAEILASRIKALDKDFPIAVHHSSLSKQVRIKAEKELKDQNLKSLICTSSLQLGIDIGTVDRIIQYQSPRQVTQLVQRVGRSGHGAGRLSKGWVITSDADDVFEAAVIARRALNNELEGISLHEKPYDVLAHQLVGLAFDFGKLEVERAYKLVKRAYPYRSLTYEEFISVARLLQRIGLIFLNGFIKRKRRSFEYYFSQLSTIPDVRQYKVFNLLENSFVGVLDEEFVALHGKPNTSFILKGEAYRIVSVENDRVLVEPTEDIEAAIPAWEGELIPVPYEVAQEVGKLRGLIASLDKTKALAWIRANYPVDQNCAEKMVEVVEKQKAFGIPTDKVVLVEDYENTVVIHTCLGSKANEALGRFIAAKLTTRFGSIGLRTDPYRIVLHLQVKNLERIKEVLLKAKPEYLKGYLELALSKDDFFLWKFVHVAKRFGVIARNAKFGKLTMEKIAEEYSDTPVFKETMKELETEKLDVERAVNFLKQIQNGEITVIFKHGLSPLAKLGVRQRWGLVAPQKPESEIFELFKQRLMNTKVRLICMNCGGWNQGYVVKKVREIKCKKCGARLLAITKYEDTDSTKLVKKQIKGRILTFGEKKILSKLRKTANLYLVYGRKAVLALAARGVGPETAIRVLAKYNRTEDDLVRELLSAERKFFRTRKYWSA